MITNRKPIFISTIVLLMLVLSACGGGSKKIDTSRNNNNDANANENEKDANADENANDNDETEVDYEATSSALAATATAIAVVQNEPTAVPPTDVPPSTDVAPPTDVPAPTSPPPTDLPPTDSASSGFSEDGSVYFTDFDVFEEEEDAWYVYTIGGSNWGASVDSGFLTAVLDAPNETLYIINNYIDMARGDADVAVEIGFDNIGLRGNNISVVCRYTDSGWYEFSLGSDGLWYMWMYQGGAYSLLANGGISGYDWKITAHTLTAACVGDYLTFAIDGVIPRGAEVTNSSLREGGVGFSISTFENGGVEVEFDYFYAEYVE